MLWFELDDWVVEFLSDVVENLSSDAYAAWLGQRLDS
jgi:hypothetical protein